MWLHWIIWLNPIESVDSIWFNHASDSAEFSCIQNKWSVYKHSKLCGIWTKLINLVKSNQLIWLSISTESVESIWMIQLNQFHYPIDFKWGIEFNQAKYCSVCKHCNICEIIVSNSNEINSFGSYHWINPVESSLMIQLNPTYQLI